VTDVIWKDEYCIGIEEIDKQHMDFIKLLNRFIIIFASGAHVSMQDRILLEIFKYFEYHCVSEENLMLISRYSKINTHEQMHNSFIKELRNKLYGIKNGSINGNDIIKYLYNHWFLNHSQTDDRSFAEYLSKKGS
jgi:hemerythrin